MAERALVSIVRRVPEQIEREYRLAWAELRAAAQQAGAKAWRFHSARDGSHFIEFLEYPAEADPRASPAVAAALDRLEQLVPGTLEEWHPASDKP